MKTYWPIRLNDGHDPCTFRIPGNEFRNLEILDFLLPTFDKHEQPIKCARKKSRPWTQLGLPQTTNATSSVPLFKFLRRTQIWINALWQLVMPSSTRAPESVELIRRMCARIYANCAVADKQTDVSDFNIGDCPVFSPPFFRNMDLLFWYRELARTTWLVMRGSG